MPAGIGYATTINLAAELTNPQPQPSELARKAAEESSRGENAREATTQERREISASSGSEGAETGGSSGGGTTPDRGQTVDLVA